MSDERAQVRLANSCNILSEVSAELPNTLPWLDANDVDKCHNLIGNDTEDICEFEKNTFGLGRRNNARVYRKRKQDLQKKYTAQRENLKKFELELQVLKDVSPPPNAAEVATLRNSLNSIYQGAKRRIYEINDETRNLKKQIVENYSMVEGSQYKDLLVYYKKIKDNLSEMDQVKNNIHYSKMKLENKTEKLAIAKGKNDSLRNVIIVFFITGLILALLFRFI